MPEGSNAALLKVKDGEAYYEYVYVSPEPEVKPPTIEERVNELEKNITNILLGNTSTTSLDTLIQMGHITEEQAAAITTSKEVI